MKSTHAQTLLNQIDMSIVNIKNIAANNIIRFSITNPIENSYLASYLTVYISGIYEETIETIIKEKFSRLNRNYVDRYIEKTVGQGFRNPNIENIRNLLKKINSRWSKIIGGLPILNKSALNSIVSNKNLLAHGQSTNLTLREVLQYYSNSRLIIEKIDEIVL